MNIKELLGATEISPLPPVCTGALFRLHHGVQHRFL